MRVDGRDNLTVPFYGCKAYEPAADGTMTGQDTDPASPTYGLHTTVQHSRKKPTCRCEAEHQRLGGVRRYCEACSAHGRDAELPKVSRPSLTQLKQAESEAPGKPLSRAMRRRAKFGGRLPAAG